MKALAAAILTGGPFDGEVAAFVPPDLNAPAQIVWSGWFPWGFDAWLYEWRGETTATGAFVETLVYRPTGRRLAPDEIPPLIAQDGEVWANAPAVWASAMKSIGFSRDVLWTGL